MIAKITVKSGKAEIVTSGIGMIFGPDDTFDMHLNFDENFKFTVRLQFIDNSEKAHPRLEIITNTDNEIITLKCINFADPIGTGTLKPIVLGTYDNRRIYLKFWVMTPEEKQTREIRYYFYLAEDN